MRTASKWSSALLVVALLAACGQGPEDSAENVAELTSDVTIYSDALNTAWQDWSWATVNLANTSPVAGGTSSIAVTYGPWTGLYLHTTGISTAGLTYLDLRVNGGTVSGAKINAKVAIGGTLGAGVPLAQYCTGGKIPANAWTRCFVPLSALGAANTTISGVVLQEGAGLTLPTMYFDIVRLDAVRVSISPTSASLVTGGSQTFKASVTNAPSTAVTWTVKEGAAGGTVSSAGVYTAPSAAGTYHVVATSQADPTKSATATVSVTSSSSTSTSTSAAVAVAVSPSTASLATTATQAFTATVTNTTNTGVTWTVQEGSSGGTISSSGGYTAPATAGTYHVVATSQADSTKTAVATVTVSAPVQSAAVAVSVSPATAALTFGGSQTFTATVTNTTNTSVSWTVQEGAAGGAISSTGTYTAPSAAGTYHVVATSQADSTKSAVATVTVTAPPTSGGGTYALPSDRATRWQPGVTYNGGIPSAAWPVQATITCTNTTGDLTAIQNAVDTGHAAHPNGVVVAIAAGVCNLNAGTITLPSYTALRGAGADATFLRVTNGATDNSYIPGSHNAPIVMVGGNEYYGTSLNLGADAAKGATSVTVSSTSGLAVGQYVLLDELSGAAWQTDPQGLGQIWASPDWRVVWQRHNPGLQTDDPYPDAWGWFSRQDRPQNEIKQITAISGSTVTFSTPVHIAYRTSHTAQLTPILGMVTNAGVEALAMRGGDQGNLRFEGAAASWARNVDSSHWINEGIAVNYSFRVEVRDSYLHDACWPSPGGAGYALSIGWGSSEFLLENSISMMANKVMVARSAGSGSVIAYNYFDDGYISGQDSWAEMGANASHMVGPHHVLFEGNYAWNGDSDKTHGNATYMTYFRNWLSGYRKPFTDIGGGTWSDLTQGGGPRRATGPAAFGYWFSFVGNVLGTQGQMSGWTYEDTANGVMTSDAKAVFALGWDDWVSAYPNVKPDPNVSSGARSVIRDGNWDWLTSSVHWHNSTATTLPSSMYLSSKPAFFGANPWPWVDPTTGSTYTLPAKARYDAGKPNVVP